MIRLHSQGSGHPQHCCDVSQFTEMQGPGWCLRSQVKASPSTGLGCAYGVHCSVPDRTAALIAVWSSVQQTVTEGLLGTRQAGSRQPWWGPYPVFCGLPLVLMAFPGMSIPISQRRELRLREVEELAQDHTASQWQSLDSHSGPSDTTAHVSYPCHVIRTLESVILGGR